MDAVEQDQCKDGGKSEQDRHIPRPFLREVTERDDKRISGGEKQEKQGKDPHQPRAAGHAGPDRPDQQDHGAEQ